MTERHCRDCRFLVRPVGTWDNAKCLHPRSESKFRPTSYLISGELPSPAYATCSYMRQTVCGAVGRLFQPNDIVPPQARPRTPWARLIRWLRS